MLELVDTYIENRLKKIKYNGASIPVYGYLPEREKGATTYPCLAYVRHEITIRDHDMRPDAETWDAGAGDTYTDDPILHDGAANDEHVHGVEHYTRKPFPTPVDVLYEILTIATKQTHNNYLTEKIFQAFPPGHTALIGDCYALFNHGKTINGDELDIPLYKSSFLLDVTDLWIERLESEEHKSIKTIDFDTETMDPITV
jgi:hypothetical protein